MTTFTACGSLASRTSTAFVRTRTANPGGSRSRTVTANVLVSTSGGRGVTALSMSAMALCHEPWQIISASMMPVETIPGRPWKFSPTTASLVSALGVACKESSSSARNVRKPTPSGGGRALPHTKHCECAS